MRILLAALLALTFTLALLAGCATPTASTPSTREPVAGGWALDCGLGAVERARAAGAQPALGLGAAWAQDCEVQASHTLGQKQEVWLAVNPLDPGNVVIGAKDLNPAASNHCVWNGLFVTKDGGATWHDVVIGGDYASRTQQSPYYGYACNTDPMGVFTRDGRLHWVVELYNLGGQDGYGPVPNLPEPVGNGRGLVQPGWKLVLAHSDDGGLTFPDDQATTLEYGDGVALLNDYSRIAADPVTGAVVTVINTYYPATGANGLPLPVAGEVCSVLSYTGASGLVQAAPVQPTFETGTPGATAGAGSLNCNGIAAKADGTLVLGALGPGGSGQGIGAYFATSHDDGATWSTFRLGFAYDAIPSPFPESAYRTGTNFELAYDTSPATSAQGHPGRLYNVVALDATSSTGVAKGDDADIAVRWSDDDGATWMAPVAVNSPDAVPAHQFMPNLAVASDGSVHVFFMDKAYDDVARVDSVTGKACGPHCFIDVTHAVSLDGGATWATERVTTVSWNGDLGKHQENFPFIGDYTGIGASGDTVWGAFPDASNGEGTVIAAMRSIHIP